MTDTKPMSAEEAVERAAVWLRNYAELIKNLGGEADSADHTALATLEALVEDHDSLRIELAHTTERAKSLKAELDAARPLLEAVEGAERWTKSEFSTAGWNAIETAALAYRAALKCREEKTP